MNPLSGFPLITTAKGVFTKCKRGAFGLFNHLNNMWKEIASSILTCVLTVKCQFTECHHDPSFEAGEDGTLFEMQFTWLGSLQYIHVKNGTPHYFRVPRVVMITRLFVLSTAVDAAQVPDGYALGNVVFGEYERDEEECGVTAEDLSQGAMCVSAALIVPLADVLLHPEYKHFGAVDSIAILKLLTPIKSVYMLPVCLPFKDFLIGRDGRMSKEKTFNIDFTSDVPREFMEEDKQLQHIHWLPRELCYIYDQAMNITNVVRNRIMCSTGCGFNSGSPSIVQERTGHWSIVTLSLGGAPCPDPLRTRRPPSPPRHISLHPYVPWITAAITGKAIGTFAKDDPFGFVMPRSINPWDRGHIWIGHWWMGGVRCHDIGEQSDDMFKFYSEIFSVIPSVRTYMNYNLELYASNGANVMCVKVGMPFRYAKPKVWDLNKPEVRVRIPVLTFLHHYKFVVEAWAYNVTDSQEDSVSNDTDNVF